MMINKSFLREVASREVSDEINLAIEGNFGRGLRSRVLETVIAESWEFILLALGMPPSESSPSHGYDVRCGIQHSYATALHETLVAISEPRSSAPGSPNQTCYK